ncbi:hypothetical protein U9M48_027289 [Paspalum notatum var. saurae]|uniref:CCHC-type domain-containing protein n=1 Tax=Paspalum notatum var. saurae TaxID=547442 RepID=A0AAQ3TYJ8_PASNO
MIALTKTSQPIGLIRATCQPAKYLSYFEMNGAKLLSRNLMFERRYSLGRSEHSSTPALQTNEATTDAKRDRWKPTNHAQEMERPLAEPPPGDPDPPPLPTQILTNPTQKIAVSLNPSTDPRSPPQDPSIDALSSAPGAPAAEIRIEPPSGHPSPPASSVRGWTSAPRRDLYPASTPGQGASPAANVPPFSLAVAGRVASSLSPAAAPFVPARSLPGRSKRLRWCEDSLDDSSPEASLQSSESYRDVLLHSLGGGGPGSHISSLGEQETDVRMRRGVVAAAGASRRGRRGSRHPGSGSSRSSSMVDAGPCRVPVAKRLGPLRRALSNADAGRAAVRSIVVPGSHFAADLEPEADGWTKVVHRHHHRSKALPVERRMRREPRPVPPELEGHCFNCLSREHVAAACRALSRCFRCNEEGHHARDCWRSRRQRKSVPARPHGSHRSSSSSGDVASCRPLSAGSIPVRSLVYAPSSPHLPCVGDVGWPSTRCVVLPCRISSTVPARGWQHHGSSLVHLGGTAWSWTGCIRFGRSVGDVPTSCMGTLAACSRTCLDPCSTKPQDAGCSPGLELDPMAWAPDPCSLGLAFDPMIVELEAARAPSSPILSGCSFEESEDLSFALAASPFPPSMVMSVTGERVDPMVVELEATLGNALVMPSSPPLFECPFAERDGPTFGPPVSSLPPSTGSSVAGCPDAGVGSPQRPGLSEPRPVGESVAPVASSPSHAVEEFVALVRAPLAPALVPGPP